MVLSRAVGLEQALSRERACTLQAGQDLARSHTPLSPWPRRSSTLVSNNLWYNTHM